MFQELTIEQKLLNCCHSWIDVGQNARECSHHTASRSPSVHDELVGIQP